MVTPDESRYLQDVAPGLVRELHETLATKPLVYRNLTDHDYGALVDQPNIISTQCDAGYLLGVPHGRQLRLFYEFDDLDLMRQEFATLVDDLGQLAIEHSDCRILTIDYNDFPHRHRVHPVLVGAEFPEPLEIALLRVRDVREQAIPDAPDGVSVRAAAAADADLLTGLEERLAGEEAIAPPLPVGFFSDARWIGIAETGGRAVGYLRLQDAGRRDLRAEEFLVDGGDADADAATISAALLHAAFEQGREDKRRALTLRVVLEAASDPVLAAHGFKHLGQELSYQRLADPAEIRRRREEKVVTPVKVGRIWGKF